MMQLLEVNYRDVFNALPGYHLLVVPEAPLFMIAAISNAFLDVMDKDRQAVVGRELFNSGIHEFLFKGSPAALNLADSLQHVMIFRESHAFDFSISGKAGDKFSSGAYYRFSNVPVLSSEDELQYILITVTRVSHADGVSNSLESQLDPQHRFKNLMMQSPVAMGILRGKEMIVEIANAPMLELWGKDARIIGLPVLEA
jgi:hypothetical protein